MSPITHVRIAAALHEAKAAARDHIVHADAISRKTREILSRTKWLREIVKGYYLLTHPSAEEQETTVWQGVYWNFLSVYLEDRFGKNYVLSPENSLDLQTKNTTLPSQIMVLTTTGGQGKMRLPHGHSLFSYRVPKKRIPSTIETHDGIRVFPLELALAKVGPAFFEKNTENAHVALRLVEPQKLARHFLEEEAPTSSAERLYQGLIKTGKEAEAERLRTSLKAGGIILHGNEVFSKKIAKQHRSVSPYAERIKLMWQTMREPVIKILPAVPGIRHKSKKKILALIEDAYTHDAYHSLSIEGYKVSEELIERVRTGKWNPDHLTEHQQIDAMAAKGYFETFYAVKASIAKAIDGEKAASVFENDLSLWFTALFSPSVHAGLLTPSDLAGYRNKPVYIRNSSHVPPAHDGLMDCMDALFECLNAETHAGVQAVLGHFIFTFIHPFHDGNGRLGRFLMNLMLVSSGYPWTIIRSDKKHRSSYLHALEAASVKRQISDFCHMIVKEMAVDWTKA